MIDCCVGSSVADLLITVVSNDTSEPSLPTGIDV